MVTRCGIHDPLRANNSRDDVHKHENFVAACEHLELLQCRETQRGKPEFLTAKYAEYTKEGGKWGFFERCLTGHLHGNDQNGPVPPGTKELCRPWRDLAIAPPVPTDKSVGYFLSPCRARRKLKR